MSRSSKSMRVGPRCGGAPPAEAVAGAAGMEVVGAIGSKAAFAADPEEELEALAGEALAVDAVLPLDLLEVFDAVAFDDDDFFEEDLAAVFFEVAAAATDGNAIVPASVDTSATTRSAVRARMGRGRVNRSLWRAVNACSNAIPLTNFVNPPVFRERTTAHVPRLLVAVPAVERD